MTLCDSNGLNSFWGVALSKSGVKKSLKFDYPPSKEVALRQIYGFATAISKTKRHSQRTLPPAKQVDFQFTLNKKKEIDKSY